MDLMRVQIKTYPYRRGWRALETVFIYKGGGGGGGKSVYFKKKFAGKGVSTTNRDILLVQVHEHKYFSFYRKNGFQAMDLKY